MEPSLPETLPSGRKRAIDELSRGREFAKKLKSVLSGSNFSIGDEMEGEHVPVDDLVFKILTSFTTSLSILKDSVDSDVASQLPATTHVGSPCWDSGRKSEDSSGESCKSTNVKDRRGCYKRRKTCHSLTKYTPDLTDDGHAWRKYGQKEILNAKFPRHYYRCTHKYDQGCQATKQVQQIEKDPPNYRTIYYGNHICKNNLLKASNHHLVLDFGHASDSSKLLCFSNYNSITSIKQDGHVFQSFPSSIKQEEKNIKEIDNNISNQSSSSGYLLPPDDDLSTFGHGSSCTTASTHSFDHIDNIIAGAFDDEMFCHMHFEE